MEKYIIDNNTEFYTYMKTFYGQKYGIKSEVLQGITKILDDSLKNNESVDTIKETASNYFCEMVDELRADEYCRLISIWTEDLNVYIFIAAAYIITFKDRIRNSIKNEIGPVKTSVPTLTLEYDNLTVKSVYSIRAITKLKITEYIENLYSTDEYFKYLCTKLEGYKIDYIGAYIQIITESFYQGSRVKSGAEFEDLIYNYLIKIGLNKEINKIERFTREKDKKGNTTILENDFSFEYKGYKFGISAKKTLRERYKQFVKSDKQGFSNDVMLTITLGTDLNKDKAERLINNGVYAFVTPEIYKNNVDLQDIEGVYDVYDLNLALLDTLISKIN